jgi:hypothetical protein
MNLPPKEFLESLEKFIAKGMATIEGQNWTITPLTESEKSVIDLAIGWAAHQYAYGKRDVPRLPIDKKSFREKAFKIASELVKDNKDYDSLNWRACEVIRQLLNEGTHFGHCCQNEYPDECKYGDSDCPVVEYKEIERKTKNISDMMIERKNLLEIVSTCTGTSRPHLEKRIYDLTIEIDAILKK